MKHIDVLAIGETLIDLISETEIPSLVWSDEKFAFVKLRVDNHERWRA